MKVALAYTLLIFCTQERLGKNRKWSKEKMILATMKPIALFACCFTIVGSGYSLEIPDESRAVIARFAAGSTAGYWSEVDAPPSDIAPQPGRPWFMDFKRALWRPMERLEKFAIPETERTKALAAEAQGILGKVLQAAARPQNLKWTACRDVPVPAHLVSDAYKEDVLVAEWQIGEQKWAVQDDFTYLHLAIRSPALTVAEKRREVLRAWIAQNFAFDPKYYGWKTWVDGELLYGIAGESKALQDTAETGDFNAIYRDISHPTTVWQEAVIFISYRDYLYVRIKKKPQGINAAGGSLNPKRF